MLDHFSMDLILAVQMEETPKPFFKTMLEIRIEVPVVTLMF